MDLLVVVSASFNLACVVSKDLITHQYQHKFLNNVDFYQNMNQSVFISNYTALACALTQNILDDLSVYVIIKKNNNRRGVSGGRLKKRKINVIVSD